MQSRVMTITPDKARKWLEDSEGTNFRKLLGRRVAQYADDMKRGVWLENGESIVLNGDGRVLDGQHRLAAVVRAGTDIRAVVVTGVTCDLFDAGATRTFNQLLKHRGEHYAACIGAATRFLWAYDNKILGVSKTYRVTGVTTKTPPSQLALYDLFCENKGLRDSAALACRALGTKASRAIIAPSILTACHYIFVRLDKGEADQYVGDITDVLELSIEDPVFVLERRLRRSKTGESPPLPSRVISALAIKAWNARRKQERPVRLTWEYGKPFPVAI